MVLGPSLGPPDRSWGAPVGPKGAFWVPSGAALGTSWGTLGRSGAPLGPRWLPGRSGGRFGVDLGSKIG